MSDAQSLLLAGAQKSCSTSLAQLLDRHPLIRMSRGEVLAFEDPHYPALLPEVSAHVVASLADGVIPALKRPEVMHRPEAAPRATAHLPRPLCVVILREPVARTLSAYHHYVSYGLIQPVHPDIGIAEILGEVRDAGKVAIRHQVVRYSSYGIALQRLRNNFGDRLLAFYQEDIVSDTLNCTTRILQSLGLSACDLGPFPRANRGNYSLKASKPSRLAGRIGYDVDEHNAVFTLTTNPIRRRAAQIFSALDRLYPTWCQPPSLSPDIERALRDVLLADVGTITEIVGRPLPDSWSCSKCS